MNPPPDSRTPRYIDLTGRSTSLKSTLSPESKLFEPSEQVFTSNRSSDDFIKTSWKLFTVFGIINLAIVLAYWISSNK